MDILDYKKKATHLSATNFSHPGIKHPVLRIVLGLIFSLTVYLLFFDSPESPAARLRRMETAMRYSQALPIYRLIGKKDPLQYKALENRILLYELAETEESKDDRSISYHNFSLQLLQGYFRHAAKPAVINYIRAHFVLLENLYLSSPQHVLQFQYPEIYGLLQPHEVGNIPALAEFLAAMEALIESAVAANVFLPGGFGTFEAGKYHHDFVKSNPLEANVLARFKAAKTTESETEIAKALLKFYGGILKLPEEQMYKVWQRLFEIALF